MYCKIAEVAAEWWIERIKEKCSHLHPDKVCKSSHELVIVDEELSTNLALFQNSLQMIILEELNTYKCFSIGCYFYPNKIFKDLARKYNISLTYFPIRAHMDIYKNSISVSCDIDRTYQLRIPT